MDTFHLLRELQLDIFAYMELPSYMSEHHKILCLVALKAAKKAGLRRRQ